MLSQDPRIVAELKLHQAHSHALDELANHSQDRDLSHGKVEPILFMLYERNQDGEPVYENPRAITAFSERVFVPVERIPSFMKISEMNRALKSSAKGSLPLLSQTIDLMHADGARNMGMKLGGIFLPLINEVIGRDLMQSLTFRRNTDRTIMLQDDHLLTDKEIDALRDARPTALDITDVRDKTYKLQIDNTHKLGAKGHGPLVTAAMLFDAARMYLGRPKSSQDKIQEYVGVKLVTQKALLDLLDYMGSAIERSPETKGLSLEDFRLALPPAILQSLKKAEHDVRRLDTGLRIHYPESTLCLDKTMEFGRFAKEPFIPQTVEDIALIVAASRSIFRYSHPARTEDDVLELANRVSYAGSVTAAAKLLASEDWFRDYLSHRARTADTDMVRGAALAYTIIDGIGKQPERFSERPREPWKTDGLPG
ncbi:MAG: hypothetical protein EB060_00655 [Proteobacteria bacterium]|nr:hypothetical protein [Pseudomonadota bacterium]